MGVTSFIEKGLFKRAGGGAGVGCGHPRNARDAEIFAFFGSKSKEKVHFTENFPNFLKQKLVKSVVLSTFLIYNKNGML
jgi:hypothetical protein